MPHSSELPALVLNIDCALREDPGYDLERQRITAASAMLRLHPAKTEDEIIAAASDANILLLEYGNTPLAARVLQNVPSCWALLKYGIGLDNWTWRRLRGRALRWRNAPLFCVEDVSDHAVPCCWRRHGA
jgi:D-3-phosphoglycerate dehydrogenase